MFNTSLMTSFGDGPEAMQELQKYTREGDVDQVKAILRGNKKLLSRKLEDGRTILHYAVAEEQEKVCLALLKKHAEVDVIDTNGDTPLHIACRMGRTSVVKLLVRYNADITCRNKDKMSASDVARKSGHLVLASSIERFLNGQKRHLFSANTSEVSSVPSQSPSFKPNLYSDSETPLVSERLLPNTVANLMTKVESPSSHSGTVDTSDQKSVSQDGNSRLQIANVRLAQQAKQLNQLNTKLTSATAKLTTSQQRIEDREKQLREMQTALNDLQHKVQTSHDQHNTDRKQAVEELTILMNKQKEEAHGRETMLLQKMRDQEDDFISRETTAEQNRADTSDTLDLQLKTLKKLNETNKTTITDINEKLSVLETEKTTTKETLSCKESELEELKKNFTESQYQRESAAADAEKLGKKLQTTENDLSIVREELSTEVTKNMQLKEMINNQSPEIASLREELETYKQQHKNQKRAADQKIAEFARLQSELKKSNEIITNNMNENNVDASETIAKLQLEHIAAVGILEGELVAYKTTIRRLQDGIAKSDNSSCALEVELHELQTKHDSVLSENESLRSEPTSTLKEKKLKELQDALNNTKETQNQSETALSKALKRQVSLEEEMEIMRTNDVIAADMAKTVKRMESELLESNNRCHVLENQNKMLSTRDEKGDELFKQIQTMENQLRLSNVKLQELENTNKSLKASVSNTPEKVNNLQSQLEEFRRENQKLQVKHAAAEEENRVLRQHEGTIATLSGTLERLESELQTTLEEKQAAIQNLEDTFKTGVSNQDLLEDNRKLQEQERRARESENHLRTNFDQKLAEVTSRHSEVVNQLQQELKRETERRSEAEEEMQSARGLRASEQKLRSENSELKGKVERITTQGSCVSEEREALLRDTESLQHEIRGQETVKTEMQSEVNRLKSLSESQKETIRELEKRVTQNALAFRVEIEQTALERKMKNELRQQVGELQKKLNSNPTRTEDTLVKNEVLVNDLKIANGRCQKLERECLLLSQTVAQEQREKDILEDKLRNVETDNRHTQIPGGDTSTLLRRTSSTPRTAPSFPIRYSEQFLSPKTSLFLQEEKQRIRLQSEQLGDINLIRGSFGKTTNEIRSEIQERYQQLDRMKSKTQKPQQISTMKLDPQQDAIRKLIMSSEESDRADIFIEYRINSDSNKEFRTVSNFQDDLLISQQAQKALQKLHRSQSSPNSTGQRASEGSTPDTNAITTKIVDDVDEKTGEVNGSRAMSVQKDPRLFYQEQCALTNVRVNTSFLDSLPANSTELTFVDLAYNYIGKKGIRAVLDVVGLCRNVQRLDLTDNKLNDVSVTWIVSIAKTHPSLTQIILDKNLISRAGGTMLLNLLHEKSTITQLSVAGSTLLTHPTARKIQQQVEQNAAAARPN